VDLGLLGSFEKVCSPLSQDLSLEAWQPVARKNALLFKTENEASYANSIQINKGDIKPTIKHKEHENNQSS
jgi:hypothetical protein